MKKMYFQAFALVLMMVFSINTRAQMTIGGDAAPRKGALLDLESTYKGGLLLPKVSITDLSKIPAGFTDSSVQSQDTNAELKGLVVYNTNTTTGEGIYVWDGEDWKSVGSGLSVDLSGAPGIWVTATSPVGGSGTAADPYTNVCPAASVELTANVGYTFGAITGGTVSGDVATFTTSGNVIVTKGSQSGMVYVAIGSCGTVPPQPTSINGLSQVVKGSTGLTYCVEAVAGATEYVWTVPAGWTITSAANNSCITVNAPNTTGSSNITVAAKNAAGTSTSRTFPVTVVDPGNMILAAGTYYLTGLTCYDVYRTFDASRGLGNARSDAFALTRTFNYTFSNTDSYSNLTFAANGGSNIIKSLTWSGSTATITFTDNVNSQLTGSTQTGTEITLYAMFTNNLSQNVQASIKLTVKDWQCCGANGTAGTLTVGSNSYLTHQYATGPSGEIQCWMVSNSKEGTPSTTTYGSTTITANPSANGYYYTNTQATTACPTGWHLPNQTEWSNLMTYVNNNQTSTQVKWWIKDAASAFAGYCSGGWYNWSNAGYWWSSTPFNQYFYASTGGIAGPSTNSFWFSVRCVQN